MFDSDPVVLVSTRSSSLKSVPKSSTHASDISISALPIGPPIGISAAEIIICSHENVSEGAPSSGVAAAHTMSDQGEPNAKDMSKAKARPTGRKYTTRRFRFAKKQAKRWVDKTHGPPPPTPGPPDAFAELRRGQFDIHGMRVDSEPARDH